MQQPEVVKPNLSSVKVVLIGDSGVGKTSLRNQYLSHRFSASYKATIGCDFVTQQIPVSDQATASLAIWDTAGQERFASLSSAFFRGSDAAILVYDITKPSTLISLKKWFYEFVERCPVETLEDRRKFCFVVVGNKGDKLPPAGVTDDEVERVEDADVRRLWEELVPPPIKQPVLPDQDRLEDPTKNRPRSSFSQSLVAASARLKSLSTFSSSASSEVPPPATSFPPPSNSLLDQDRPSPTNQLHSHSIQIHHSEPSSSSIPNYGVRSSSPGKILSAFTDNTQAAHYEHDHPELHFLSQKHPGPPEPSMSPPERSSLAPPPILPPPTPLPPTTDPSLPDPTKEPIKPTGGLAPSIKTTASSLSSAASFNTARTNLSSSTITSPSSSFPPVLASSPSSFYAFSSRTFKRSDSNTSQPTLTSRLSRSFSSSLSEDSTSTVRPSLNGTPHQASSTSIATASSRSRSIRESLTPPGMLSPSLADTLSATGEQVLQEEIPLEITQRDDEEEEGEEVGVDPPLRVPAEMPMFFFATSAKTGEGVSGVFEYVAKRVLERWEYEEKNPFVREDPVSAPPSRIHLDWIRKPKGAKAGCC